jgi:hypothetical protein
MACAWEGRGGPRRRDGERANISDSWPRPRRGLLFPRPACRRACVLGGGGRHQHQVQVQHRHQLYQRTPYTYLTAPAPLPLLPGQAMPSWAFLTHLCNTLRIDRSHQGTAGKGSCINPHLLSYVRPLLHSFCSGNPLLLTPSQLHRPSIPPCPPSPYLFPAPRSVIA